MSQGFHDIILNSLWEGVVTVDEQLLITYFNRAAEEMTGYTARDVVGQPFETVFEPTKCRCQEVIGCVLREGADLRDEPTRIQCLRPSPFPILLNAAPMRSDDGKVVGAVMSFRDQTDVETLRRELKCEYCQHDIVTKSHRMRQILDILPNVAESESPVLILGESGTGKELLARAIHMTSPRENGPFIAVNCGALPDNLLESELFGYKAGAFTDAKKDKPGRFALAQNGTLFLDEIGEISLAMQVKLLRVLQEKRYEPLGAVESVETNARIIAATNREPREMMEEGTFRTDLYYRINVVELRLPSLAERREDIPLLVEHFIQKHNAEKGKAISGISQAAMNRLMSHPFRGNIRELENIVERAYVMCPFDTIQEGCLQLDGAAKPECAVGASDAPVSDAMQESPTPALASAQTSQWQSQASTPGMLDARRKVLRPEEERQAIAEALSANNGHRRRTAEALGIDPSTLWRKMKKYGMDS